ncbi:MAG: fluoride exporter [Thermoleophilaceae bacterium]|nr:fluoride exporter [Thermoleophilaceae bacterium]
MTVLCVAAGGVAGVLARYGLGTLFSTDRLPALTVAINVVGSFALGLVVAVGHELPAAVRTGLAVGLLGGFTTFSTFSVDVFLDIETGRPGEAFLYLAASVLVGVAAAAAGYYAGRAVV